MTTILLGGDSGSVSPPEPSTIDAVQQQKTCHIGSKQWPLWLIAGVIGIGAALVLLLLHVDTFHRASGLPPPLFALQWFLAFLFLAIGTLLQLRGARHAKGWKSTLWIGAIVTAIVQVVSIILWTVFCHIMTPFASRFARLGTLFSALLFWGAALAQFVLAAMMPAWWNVFLLLPVLATAVAYAGGAVLLETKYDKILEEVSGDTTTRRRFTGRV